MTDFFIDNDDKQNFINNIILNSKDKKGQFKIYAIKPQIKPILNLYLINDVSNIVIEYFEDSREMFNVEYTTEIDSLCLCYIFKIKDIAEFEIIPTFGYNSRIQIAFKSKYFINMPINKKVYVEYSFDTKDILYQDYVQTKLINNSDIQHRNNVYYFPANSPKLNEYKKLIKKISDPLINDWNDFTHFINSFMKQHCSINNFITLSLDKMYDYTWNNNFVTVKNIDTNDIVVRKIINPKQLIYIFCIIKVMVECIANIEKNIRKSCATSCVNLLNGLSKLQKNNLNKT